MELWKEEQNYSILFKQFPPDNEQFHQRIFPDFPGKGGGSFHLSACAHLCESSRRQPRIHDSRDEARDISTILDVRTRPGGRS